VGKRRSRLQPLSGIVVALGIVAFLYFARPVLLPLMLACLASMALKPLMHWLSLLRIPTAPSAAVVFLALVASLGIGFLQLGRPAIHWIDDAPEHMTELRGRLQKLFPTADRIGNALDSMGDLGATESEKKTDQKKTPTVEVKDQRGTASILNWTGTVLAGLGEVLVLIYLILASGDLFLHKLVRVMPTLRDKKKAIEISREVQANISNYLFSVLLDKPLSRRRRGGGLLAPRGPEARDVGDAGRPPQLRPVFRAGRGYGPAGHRRPPDL
jgi:predicted PurR-regulated permease PerM